MTSFARIFSSPRALLVFEAAARTGSLTAASTEFNVSQPSVSRTISQLEADLGLKLFARTSRGLRLTIEGEELHAAVREGFDRIASTLDVLEQRKCPEKAPVHLSVSTSFATQWLIPRLAEFNTSFPNVDLRLKLIPAIMNDLSGEFDIATRMIGENDNRYHRFDFAPEIIFPVASQKYIDENGMIDVAGNENRHTFLHLADHTLDRWDPFLNKPRGKKPQAGTWIEFSDYSVALQAAAQGKGVALGWISVVASALHGKTLVPASRFRLRTGATHHLIVPKNKTLPPQTFEICEWLINRMAKDTARLEGEFI